VNIPVSVIIPTYNSSHTILRCLDSVLSQTHRPSQVVIIDDASTDNTVNLLSNYISSSPLNIILYVNKTNHGPAYSRNRGWDYSTQPFIAFLDSDDEWHPQKLQYQYSLISSSDSISAVATGFSLYNPVPLTSRPNYTRVSPLLALLRNPFVTPSVIMRTSIGLRFPNRQYYMEDHFLWCQLLLQQYLVLYIDFPFVILHKPLLSAHGLSSSFLLMEAAQYRNLLDLYKSANLPLLLLIVLFFVVYPAKFFLRLPRIILPFFTKQFMRLSHLI